MEKLINDLCLKVGVDRATAEKVAIYLKDNVTKIPALLQGDGEKAGIVSKISDVLGHRP